MENRFSFDCCGMLVVAEVVMVAFVSSTIFGVLFEVGFRGLVELGIMPGELINESSEYFLLRSTGIFELSPGLARLGSGFIEKLGLRVELLNTNVFSFGSFSSKNGACSRPTTLGFAGCILNSCGC